MESSLLQALMVSVILLCPFLASAQGSRSMSGRDPGDWTAYLGWIGPARVLLMWRDDEGSHLTLHRIVPR